MALSTHEMFDKLLEQLALPDDVTNYPGFQTATIERVIVHQQSRRYEFTFGFDAILPFTLFSQFATQLELAFKEIAAVDFNIQVQHPEISEALLAGYWQYVVDHAGIASGMVRELCDKQVPQLQDERVVLTAENEPVRQFLINQGIGKLEESYQRVGFSNLRITTLVDEGESEAKLAAFKAQKRKKQPHWRKRLLKALKKRPKFRRTILLVRFN